MIHRGDRSILRDCVKQLNILACDPIVNKPRSEHRSNRGMAFQVGNIPTENCRNEQIIIGKIDQIATLR